MLQKKVREYIPMKCWVNFPISLSLSFIFIANMWKQQVVIMMVNNPMLNDTHEETLNTEIVSRLWCIEETFLTPQKFNLKLWYWWENKVKYTQEEFITPFLNQKYNNNNNTAPKAVFYHRRFIYKLISNFSQNYF